jgi:hypothetical protein
VARTFGTMTAAMTATAPEPHHIFRSIAPMRVPMALGVPKQMLDVGLDRPDVFKQARFRLRAHFASR